MDKPRFMADSNVLIDTLNRRVNLIAFFDTLPECETYINPVVWAETLAKPGMTEMQEAEARSLLSCFLWAELDQPILEEAARIRRAGSRFCTADCSAFSRLSAPSAMPRK